MARISPLVGGVTFRHVPAREPKESARASKHVSAQRRKKNIANHLCRHLRIAAKIGQRVAKRLDLGDYLIKCRIVRRAFNIDIEHELEFAAGNGPAFELHHIHPKCRDAGKHAEKRARLVRRDEQKRASLRSANELRLSCHADESRKIIGLILDGMLKNVKPVKLGASSRRNRRNIASLAVRHGTRRHRRVPAGRRGYFVGHLRDEIGALSQCLFMGKHLDDIGYSNAGLRKQIVVDAQRNGARDVQAAFIQKVIYAIDRARR